MKENKLPIIVGLDIGTTKTVVIAGRKNESGKLEVIGYGESESIGMCNGTINIEQCAQSIHNAVKKCIASKPDLEIKDIHAVISGQHIKSIKTSDTCLKRRRKHEIAQKDIDALITREYKTRVPSSDQIIDVIPYDFVIDDTVYAANPIGSYGSKISASFNIITADKNAIHNVKRSIEKAGVKIESMLLQPLISSTAVATQEDLQEGVIIVDIGGNTTNMAIFHNGVLKHTSAIPYAGVNVTDDIRKGLGLLRSQAELLKTEHGNAVAATIDNSRYVTLKGLRGLPTKEISLKMLAIIIENAVRNILHHIMHDLRRLNLDKCLHGGIILTGGGAQLKNIVQLAEQITGMNVRIGTADEYITGDYAEIMVNPAYSACIGLILKTYADVENAHVHGTPDVEAPYIAAKEKTSFAIISSNGRERIKRQNGILRKSYSNWAGMLKESFLGLFGDFEEQPMM